MRNPLLTTRERVAIAFAVGSLTFGLRFVIVVATRRLLGAESFGDLRLTVASITPLVLLPWGLTLVERFHDCRSNVCRLRTGALVVGYGVLCIMVAVATYGALVLLGGEPFNRVAIVTFVPQYAAWSLVVLLIGGGVGEAVRGYRAALLEGERRHERDMTEANVARRAIELRTRPDTVIAMLASIAERTLADPAGARLLLLRLARHQRALFMQPASPSLEDELRIVRSTVALFRRDVQLEIGHCEAFPDLDVVRPWLRALESALIAGPPGRYLVECDRRQHSAVLHMKSADPDQVPLQASVTYFPEALQPVFSASGGISVELPLARPDPIQRQPETRGGLPSSFGSSAFTAALVVYVLAAVLPELTFLDRQPVWNLTVITLASAVLWLVAGPLVYAITARCVRLRLSVAFLLSTTLALSGAAAVTLASLGVLRLVTIGDEFSLAFLPLVASRNVNAAFIVCTCSFAQGFSRLLIAARADAMRAEHETVRAEARELEARFHPHFLFNALASIAGLIRLDPGAAGEMCRLLARLVARSRAYAGVPSWTVNDEVTFVADYLAIQRRRFANRLRIAKWEVVPSTTGAAFPRLSLQPLVENIFNHAVASSCGVISMGLSIAQRDRMLTVEVWNDLADGPSTPGHGRGLAFVSSRVRDAGGRILIVPAENRFTVQLTIPIRKPPPTSTAIPRRA